MKVNITIQLDEPDNVADLKAVLDEFVALDYDLENIMIISYTPVPESVRQPYGIGGGIMPVNHGFIETVVPDRLATVTPIAGSVGPAPQD